MEEPSDETVQPKKERFLQAVALCGNITQAAKVADVGRQSHYDWKNEDPDYPARFASAMDHYADLLETEAHRRAVDGVRRLKFQGGHAMKDPQTGEPYVEYTYSDRLLERLLEAARPEKFGRHQEVTVKDKTDAEQRQGFIARRMAHLDRLLAGPRSGTSHGGNGQGGNGRLGGNGKPGTIEPA